MTRWLQAARQAGDPLAEPAPERVLSVMSVLSEGNAVPPTPSARPYSGPGVFPYGTARNLGENPRTCTGRIVSLAEWRALSACYKNDPSWRRWNGISRKWEPPD